MMVLLLKLSFYWFLVTGALGVIFPYYTLYLNENVGLTGSQVGIVFATTPFISIFAQPLWGQIADLTGMRTRLMAFLAFGASVGYVILTLPQTFIGLLLATAVLSFFSSSLLPMGVSVSLATLESRGVNDFGRVRVWGTVGFLVSVVSIPVLLDKIQVSLNWNRQPGGPSEPGLQNMFFIASILVALASIVAWSIPRYGSVSLKASRGDFRLLISNGRYLRVLVFAFSSFFFLQGPMALFPVYIRSKGGDMSVVSYMWIWMLLLEIPLVLSIGPIIQRIGPKTTVCSALVAAGIRWLTCALIDDLNWIYPIQMLHAVFVAGLIIGTPLYVEMIIPERLRSTGQGILTTLGMNVGGILSITGSGFLLERLGADSPYMVGGVGAIIVGCLAWLILPRI